MTSKGFTMVELLAVIVILSIISLISTPMIINLINESEKKSVEISADNYIKAIEKQLTLDILNDSGISDGIHDVPINGIDIDGSIPTKGWIKIVDGKVIDYSFVIDNYVVTKDSKIVKGSTTAEKPI